MNVVLHLLLLIAPEYAIVPADAPVLRAMAARIFGFENPTRTSLSRGSQCDCRRLQGIGPNFYAGESRGSKHFVDRSSVEFVAIFGMNCLALLEADSEFHSI
jgi:hypothetical protein